MVEDPLYVTDEFVPLAGTSFLVEDALIETAACRVDGALVATKDAGYLHRFEVSLDEEAHLVVHLAQVGDGS